MNINFLLVNYLSHFFVYAIIPIIIGIIYELVMKSNSKKLLINIDMNCIIIRLPKIFGWIGVIFALFCLTFLILMIISPNGTGGIWTGIVFSIGILIGLLLILPTSMFKVYVFKDKKYFIYTTSFGRTYKINYSDIIKVKETENVLYFKTNKKRFFVDTWAENVEELRKKF